MFNETKADSVDTQPRDEGLPVADSVALEPGLENGVLVPAGDHSRFAAAGRKGAARVHELIHRGWLYEQEHGLKRGRQRLRQLIEEGKLYEVEHGLREGRKPRQRLGKLSREQLLRTFLESVNRMVRPLYRERLKEVIATLDTKK
jgi:hypothetical protein